MLLRKQSGVAKNGKKLASMANKVARRRHTFGWCYAGAAESIRRALGDKLWGGSAYMAAAQLSRSKNFMEIKVTSNELKKLPTGAVVVWNKRSGGPPWPHIHCPG